MTISIADSLLTSADGLSEKARRVLALIDGGTQWLDWALSDTSTHHQFSDEPSLIAGIRENLNAANGTPSHSTGNDD